MPQGGDLGELRARLASQLPPRWVVRETSYRHAVEQDGVGPISVIRKTDRMNLGPIDLFVSEQIIS